MISALGYFKLMLDENFCRLGIYQFSDPEKKYINFDTYQPNQSGNCKSIRVDNNRIVTDTGF